MTRSATATEPLKGRTFGNWRVLYDPEAGGQRRKVFAECACGSRRNVNLLLGSKHCKVTGCVERRRGGVQVAPP